MPIKNAIHSQQVYDPTNDSIMAEQELCMERLYDYNHIRPSEHAKRAQLLKEMLAECGAGLLDRAAVSRQLGRKAQTLGRFFVKIDKNRKSCNKPVICCVIWIKGFIERSRR